MPPALFDSHCHLDPMRFGAELPDVLARARAAGVTGMTVIGTRAADSEAAAELAAREQGVMAAAGIHPNDTGDLPADEWDRVVKLASSGRVNAIGETGLLNRLLAPLRLLRGERHTDGGDAVVLHRVQHHSAPPAADIEEAHSWLQSELAADEIELLLLCYFQ